MRTSEFQIYVCPKCGSTVKYEYPSCYFPPRTCSHIGYYVGMVKCFDSASVDASNSATKDKSNETQR